MILLPCLTGCLLSHCHFPAGLGSLAGLCFPDVLWSDTTTIAPSPCAKQMVAWNSSPQSTVQRGVGSRRSLGTSLRRHHSHILSQNICALDNTVMFQASLQRVRDFLGKESVARIQPCSHICASLYAQQHVCKLKRLKLIMCKTVCIWEDLDCRDEKNWL